MIEGSKKAHRWPFLFRRSQVANSETSPHSKSNASLSFRKSVYTPDRYLLRTTLRGCCKPSSSLMLYLVDISMLRSICVKSGLRNLYRHGHGNLKFPCCYRRGTAMQSSGVACETNHVPQPLYEDTFPHPVRLLQCRGWINQPQYEVDISYVLKEFNVHSPATCCHIHPCL